jgi:addiction module RelE/StbE family toxin
VLTLVWRERARRDVTAAIEYIAAHNTAAADHMESVINAFAERLTEHPYMCRSGRIPGTREGVVHPNYILVYRITADAIEIVRVIHAHQQFP